MKKKVKIVKIKKKTCKFRASDEYVGKTQKIT